jgi:hypothetical protein
VSREIFAEAFKNMPWFAMPLYEGVRRSTISYLFKQTKQSQLLIFNSKGSLVTESGYEDVALMGE